MREIKFRVWDKSCKIMHICGTNIHDDCFYDEDNKFHYYNLQNGEGSGKNGNYILMQYTGLHDKNGKEIYEGDILKGTFYGFPMTVYDYIFQAYWDEKEKSFMASYFEPNECEVIRKYI